MVKKTSLAGLFPAEIQTLLKSGLGQAVPDFRTQQICQWIKNGTGDFMHMKNLPLPLRNELAEKFTVFSSVVGTQVQDRDGTVKIQVILEDGNKIEAVILHDGKGRKTACISTQAGCACGCVFCKTGQLGLKRSLKANEIIEQFLLLRNIQEDISHIVIMGMGEPLLNLEEVRKAIGYFTSREGTGISKRRITLSTAGIADGIRDLADNGPDIRLAVSLTSAIEQLRQQLMPIALSNPLPLLKESLLYYQQKQKQRITLEAVLLSGINTNEDDAQAIANFAHGLECVINLIPWNAVEGMSLNGNALIPPTAKEVALFKASLEKRKLKVTLRMGKGKGVCGACGQLG